MLPEMGALLMPGTGSCVHTFLYTDSRDTRVPLL